MTSSALLTTVPPSLSFRRWTWRTWQATSRASWACLMEGSSTVASLKLSSAGSQLCDFLSWCLSYFFRLPCPALLSHDHTHFLLPGNTYQVHVPNTFSSHERLPHLRMNDECTVSTKELFFLKPICSAIWPLNPDHELPETFSILPSLLTPMPLTISDLIPAHVVPELKLLTKCPNHYSIIPNTPWNLNPNFIDPSIPLPFQLALDTMEIKQSCRQLCLDFSNLESVMELLMIYPPLLVLKPSRSIAMIWFWSLPFVFGWYCQFKILINCLKIKLLCEPNFLKINCQWWRWKRLPSGP